MIRRCLTFRCQFNFTKPSAATSLSKKALKSSNPFPTAKRTVIFEHSATYTGSAVFPQPADMSDSSAPKGPLSNYEAGFNFPKMEEEVLAMWREKDAFRTSVKMSEGKKPFVFFDGPPFATGLPHYGHILAGTIKDMVTRFAHQTGHHVPRRFGWDCHGLPVEHEIDKKFDIKGVQDVMKMGIAAYNTECEAIVMRYASEWRKTVERMGRWIDFDNDYKTMRLPYMESVWWAFATLYKKGLVYRGVKVMPCSTGCTTPLSNFEANLNYQDVTDPCVTVAFQSTDDANTYYLAWTTTPWTLPSNLALCVHKDVDYVKVLDAKTGRHYFLAEALLSSVYPKKKTDKKKKDEGAAAKDEAPYQVLEKVKGSALVGKHYNPLFPYFAHKKDTAFRIISGDYVTTESGTGIVHQAPYFGEDDYQACVAFGIVGKDDVPICPVDDSGLFTAAVTDFAGRYVKEADPDIIKFLEGKGHIMSKGSIVHSYPFCWRSKTPLLYKAVEAWFVNVESFRDQLVECNDSTYWVPDFVKSRRFTNWLQQARDWNVSRNRYWGTPLPVWHSEDWEEVVVVSSVAELEELTGKKGIDNLHRQFIDDLTIPSKRPGVAPLKRISVVFDCWFESGSMPYGQQHYPFENREYFEQNYPANFISEGLDQTRGWFYTLLILGVALFGKAPFQNVCVSGLILAEDGKKMSKSERNYPDPATVIDLYGADAIRMYIINSPVVRGEPLCFKESGVQAVIKDVMLPMFNALKFFTTNANLCIAAGGRVSVDVRSTNEMDRWILSSTQTLLRYVKKEMELYHLYNVVPGILRFVVDLSNWYVRMNRRRMKSNTDPEDRQQALSTMLVVFFAVSRIMGHIAPFVSEMVYQGIKPILPADQQVDSVHYLMIPDEDPSLDDEDLERAMSRMINIVELVRVLRDRLVIPIKRPVRQVMVVHPDPQYRADIERVVKYVADEVNAFSVTMTDGKQYVETHLDANFEVLGKKFRKEMPAIRKAIQAMTPEDVDAFVANKGGVVAGQQLTLEDVRVLRKVKEGFSEFESNSDNDVVVLLDKSEDQALVDSWRAREFVNRVQQLRKKAKLVITDVIRTYFESEDEELSTSILNCAEQINKTLGDGMWKKLSEKPADAQVIAEEENSISDINIRLVITRA